MLISIVNGFFDVIELICQAVFMILPDTPFKFDPLDWGPFGMAVGYFFPVQSMFAHMVMILTAFLGYYCIRWLLRIIKQVR